MVQFFVESSFDPALTKAGERALFRRLSDCLRLHEGEWQEGLLARNRRRMLCRFEARDLSALYRASHCASIEVDALWAGTVYRPPQAASNGKATSDGLTDVIGERTFAVPITLSELLAREQACLWCLEQHRVQLVQLFLSRDGRRAVTLFRAPDAESVRQAYRHAETPFDRVWPYRRVAGGASAQGRASSCKGSS